MDREEIKGFLLGISVGVGIGYYLLKSPSGVPEPAVCRIKSSDPKSGERTLDPSQSPANRHLPIPIDSEWSQYRSIRSHAHPSPDFQ